MMRWGLISRLYILTYVQTAFFFLKKNLCGVYKIIVLLSVFSKQPKRLACVTSLVSITVSTVYLIKLMQSEVRDTA